jgi:hypothetical protein
MSEMLVVTQKIEIKYEDIAVDPVSVVSCNDLNRFQCRAAATVADIRSHQVNVGKTAPIVIICDFIIHYNLTAVSESLDLMEKRESKLRKIE